MTGKKNKSKISKLISRKFIFKIIYRLTQQVHSSIFGIRSLNLFSIETSACIFPPIQKITSKYLSHIFKNKFDFKDLFKLIKPKWFFKGRSTMT